MNLFDAAILHVVGKEVELEWWIKAVWHNRAEASWQDYIDSL